MSKHTPWPWTVGGKYAHKTVLLNAKGKSIASGGNNRAVQGAELEASLRLAAAAPELLEALREAIEVVKIFHGPDAWDIYEKQSPEMKRWRTVIAKAKGE